MFLDTLGNADIKGILKRSSIACSQNASESCGQGLAPWGDHRYGSGLLTICPTLNTIASPQTHSSDFETWETVRLWGALGFGCWI